MRSVPDLAISQLIILSMRTGSISVGKHPALWRVRYALTTPMLAVTELGGIPSPVKTPPIVELDDVTIGYVPDITQ